MDKIDGYTIKIIGQDNRPDDMYDPEELKAGIECLASAFSWL